MAARASRRKGGARTAPPAPTTRVEHDTLGSVTLPADALYGIHTARAVENLGFTTRPLGSCPPYVHALGSVKRAAARANREAGVLTARVADAIEAATAPLLASQLLEQFPADLLGGGGSIGVHMNVNEVIANLASEHLGGRRGDYVPVHPFRHVSASQSTADVCHTALRLAVLNQWKGLRRVLGATVQTLRTQADGLADVPTLSRTCLQDALPSSLGVLFGDYAALLQRRTGELERTIHALRAVGLGGTVIGTADGAPPRYRERVLPILSEIAGWALVAREPLPDALQNSDDIGGVSAQLALLAQALIKIAQDLRLLASGPQGGFGEISLPHVQAGSSFFSGKQNPVIPETVLQCAFQVLGCDRAVQAAVEHGELYLNVFDGLAAVNVLDAVDMLAGAVDRFEARCLRGLRANADRCRALAAFGKRV
jgi:aspartate ammonia-lyase